MSTSPSAVSDTPPSRFVGIEVAAVNGTPSGDPASDSEESKDRGNQVVVNLRAQASVALACAVMVIGCTDVTPSAIPTTTRPAIPDVVHVTCDIDGIELSTNTVAARSEGVLARFAGPNGGYEHVRWYVWTSSDGQTGSDSVDSPSAYLPIPPGKGARLSCVPRTMEFIAYGSSHEAELQVVDPNDNWLDDRLDCRSHTDFARDVFTRRDPVAISEAGHEVAALLEGYGIVPSEVRPAGYVTDEAPVFVAVREGKIIAQVPSFAAGPGMVTIDTTGSVCDELVPDPAKADS